MKRLWFSIAIVSALMLLIGVLPCFASEPAKSIMVYSGAGMRKPMNEIGKVFQERFGTDVHYNYAG